MLSIVMLLGSPVPRLSHRAGPQPVRVFIADELFLGGSHVNDRCNRCPMITKWPRDAARWPNSSDALGTVRCRMSRASLRDAHWQGHLAVLELHFVEELFRLALKSSACRSSTSANPLAHEHSPKLPSSRAPAGTAL